jgi:hypothetical protein
MPSYPRAYLAACLAMAFRGTAVDPLAAAVRESARFAICDLQPSLSPDRRAELSAEAERLRDATARLPWERRVPVLAAIVRELLADAPDCCLRLDRAVRDACERRYGPGADEAATILAGVRA